MDITSYRKKQAEVQAQVALHGRRLPCHRCLQPNFSCYCELLKPIDTSMMFVILIHPIEVARRIATGRMAHLCLKNSKLIAGHDFTRNANVNAILADPQNHCVMLYPGAQSLNLGSMPEVQKARLTPANKKLVIFVIDGTWNTARKTVHVSQNLRELPRICFTPSKPSSFRIRKQPRAECYSTIEAIHQTIDLLQSPASESSVSKQSGQQKNSHSREHDHLLYVFEKMVARQLELAHSETWSPWSALALPALAIPNNEVI